MISRAKEPLQSENERYNDMIEHLILLKEHNKRQEAFNRGLPQQLLKRSKVGLRNYLENKKEDRPKKAMPPAKALLFL